LVIEGGFFFPLCWIFLLDAGPISLEDGMAASPLLPPALFFGARPGREVAPKTSCRVSFCLSLVNPVVTFPVAFSGKMGRRFLLPGPFLPRRDSLPYGFGLLLPEAVLCSIPVFGRSSFFGQREFSLSPIPAPDSTFPSRRRILFMYAIFYGSSFFFGSVRWIAFLSMSVLPSPSRYVFFLPGRSLSPFSLCDPSLMEIAPFTPFPSRLAAPPCAGPLVSLPFLLILFSDHGDAFTGSLLRTQGAAL